jgi:hypothetical protein
LTSPRRGRRTLSIRMERDKRKEDSFVGKGNQRLFGGV